MGNHANFGKFHCVIKEGMMQLVYAQKWNKSVWLKHIRKIIKHEDERDRNENYVLLVRYKYQKWKNNFWAIDEINLLSNIFW